MIFKKLLIASLLLFVLILVHADVSDAQNEVDLEYRKGLIVDASIGQTFYLFCAMMRGR